MISTKLKKFLDHEKVEYGVVTHPEKFTAQEIAAVEHVPGRQVAKVVMVKAASRDVMTVIPANHTLDLFKLSEVLGTTAIRVEEEKEFSSLFPDCQPGAMPPIGSYYRIPCYVDVRLTGNKQIFFNAGSHEESIQIATADYLRIAEAEIADLVAGE